MVSQPGFFDLDDRYAALSKAGDPLVRLKEIVPFETFPARFRSGGRSSPVEPGQALHVVGEIGEADLGGCGGRI
ncbi:MAG: hypothetical protein LGL72_03145 [Acidibrevibacterium sp.]|uniref:hypothetical protein n=1 Tax=Acidibrevibacterium fodinaquatile TaxID=1969806 RepID=UPI0023A8C964|nr:hypothetical protein [Acidibrevibacterium fodinaquatile]MCA7118403.1 hypothetical protein [Acidibrevibacterium fodinaquatile]